MDHIINIAITVIGLVLIALKLFGYIDWSWWLITMPIYGPIIVNIILDDGLL